MQHVDARESGVVEWRSTVAPADCDRIRDITVSTGMFSAEETEIAVELAEENLAKGDGSGYSFLFAVVHGRLVGFTCYGLIPGSEKRYEIYWIAVEKNYQGQGVGTMLMKKTEEAILVRGGVRAYIETSSRSEYKPTQAFYIANGYVAVAELADYFRDGDGKIIFMKNLRGSKPQNLPSVGMGGDGTKAAVAVPG